MIDPQLADELADLRRRVAELQQREARQRLLADDLGRHSQQLADVLEQLPVVTFTCRPEGDYGATFISQGVREVTGYRAEQFLADSAFWVERVHPEDRPRILAALPEVMPRGRFEFEYRWRVADGSYRWFEALLRTVRDPGGRIQHLAGAWRDVTERRQAQLERERAFEEASTLLAGLPVVIYICAATGNYETTYISPNVTEVLGYRPEQFTGDGLFWIDRVHPGDRARIIDLFTGLFRQDTLEYEYRWRLADGRWVWILDLLKLVRAADGTPARILGAMHDITARKRNEQELHDTRTQARALSARLFDAHEQVERRLAERIHDDLSQNLAAMQLDLSWLRRQVQPGATSGRVERLIRLAESTLASLQGVATDLRPTLLDDLGLVPAVSSLVRELARRSGLEVSLHVDPPGLSLDDERSTGVYRMLREALTNVERHAGARTVRVELVLADGELAVSVHDDGRGITAEELRSPRSLGLAGLLARAESLGGRVQVAGTAGAGTRVTIRLPAEGAMTSPPAHAAPGAGLSPSAHGLLQGALPTAPDTPSDAGPVPTAHGAPRDAEPATKALPAG